MTMTSTTYTYTDLDTTFDTLAQAKAYAVTALGMAIESYEKDLAWTASGYSVLGDLSFYREDSGGWSVRIWRDGDCLKIEDEPTPTDAAPVTGQPAPTFDELRAATNAASAAELAAHNALVKAENAYASAAEVDPNDRHGWNKATGRFARTKAGQELHAALTEARKTLREAVRVDTEACRKTWVNGFGTLSAPAEQPAPVDPSSLALDPENNDFQRGYADGYRDAERQRYQSYAYEDGYHAGQADLLSLANRPDNSHAEIARLNRIITDLQADMHTCERKVKAAQDAADNAATAALAEIEQLTARANSMEWAHVVNAQRIAVEKSRTLPHIYIASFVTSGAIYSDPYEVMAGSQLPQMLEKLSKYTAWAIAKDSTVIQTSTDRLTTH